MQQPPAPPATPAPPAPPARASTAPVVASPSAQVSQTAPARPLTPSEVAAIRARRSELSSQLTSAEGRRNELAAQLEDAEGQNRIGLEQRLAVLDQRIVQLETDIAETGRLLTSPRYTTSTQQRSDVPFGLSPGQVTGVSVVFTLFVLAPIALAYARAIWKRATRATMLPDTSELTRRLAGLEQGIEAIAVEVERVSEGQRYVTKLFAEGRGHGALPAGERPAEPLRVGHAERVPVPRNGA